MIYRIVEMASGQMVSSDVVNVIEWAEVRGYRLLGQNENTHQRKELQGQPVFSGLMGPMWDGDAVRYECERTYAMLSS